MSAKTQKEMDTMLENLEREGKAPTLLLHSCCAPCSSYVLTYLARFFNITVYFDNPNIAPQEEYQRRAKEQQRLINALSVRYPILFKEGQYEPEAFERLAVGLEQEPEGGMRCTRCYGLRLRRAAVRAKAGAFDFFTTTLSVSPHKNADKLNQIGHQLGERYGVRFLAADFKKKDGYRQSVALSKEYQLYRQDYCGCRFSKEQREREKEQK